jgi:anti-sigma factor RsiW
MIDPRTLELIHAAIDAELDPQGSSELQRRLAADPEARALHGQLARMAGVLGQMPPVDPPAGLQEQILSALPVSAKVLPFRPRRVQIARYAMALAASLIIGVIGFGFGGGRLALDADQLVGTMGRKSPDSAPATTQVALQAPGLSGSVALDQANGRWLLVFDLASQQPVSVTAAYADAAFRFKGYAGKDSVVGAVTATPGQIAFVNQGAQHLALEVEPGAGGQVRISFTGQGKLLQQAVLDVPSQGQAR